MFVGNKGDIQIVVSRFNETLDWLRDDPFNRFPVIIYNKGQNENFYRPPLLKEVVSLTNVGRESHTYLYHIINNYDRLADITVFLPGSVELPHKYDRSKNVVNSASETNKTTLACQYDETFMENEKHFQIDNYESSNVNNREANPDNQLNISKIRPFGKWYESLFKNDEKNNCFAINSILAVSKHDIQQKPVDYYSDFIDTCNSHPNEETVHYLERSWYAMFYPYENGVNFTQ
jgi:hypothetical protein